MTSSDKLRARDIRPGLSSSATTLVRRHHNTVRIGYLEMGELKKYHAFAVKVSAAAKTQDLSQTQVAKVCGVTPQSVQRWFTGSSLPRPSHMPSLAEALGLSIEELVADVEELHFATQLKATDAPTVPSVVSNLWDSQIALNKAISNHAQCAAVATKLAYEKLTEQLSYEGYYLITNESTLNNSFTVERDGVVYQIELHVRAPNVGDTIRIGRRQQAPTDNVVYISAYTFWNAADANPRFFILPAKVFLTREGIELLKVAASPELVELHRGSWGELDAISDEARTAMAHSHPLWEFVDHFDISDVVAQVSDWELIRHTH